jgi:hypothetical protein
MNFPNIPIHYYKISMKVEMISSLLKKKKRFYGIFLKRKREVVVGKGQNILHVIEIV